MGRFSLTTPIYYVNDAPHVGHAYTTVTADAVARWHRLLGDDVFFLTGTDEHGLKVAQVAEANGASPQEWADRTAVRFQDAWKLLDISNDDFIRTTEARHYAAVEKLLRACYEAGDIELDTYTGWYSVSDEEYITEAEVEEYRSRGRRVEEMSETNYFFRLSRFEDRLLAWYEEHPDAIQPASRRNEVLGFIKGGLQDFSVSRTSLTWGIPIPWDPGHVAYVWFDALTNYLTAAGYGSDPEAFERRWPAHHMIGKDIIRFHNVYWPAMLLSAGVEPPAGWFVHGWLLVGGEKMSKTRLNQIAPADLVADFGVDGYRYHFLADIAFGDDSDFSYERMVARYNADLANNLGNLLSRVATVVAKQCAGIGPTPSPDSPLASAAADALAGATTGWAAVQPAEALAATWRLVRATNAHLEANEPWKAEPGPGVDAVLGDALEALRIVAILASPAVPTASQSIWERLGLSGRVDEERLPAAAAWGGYPGGLPVVKGGALFPHRDVTTGVVQWCDSHCHLEYHDDDTRAAEAVADAEAAGVTRLVTIGTDAARSADAIAIAAQFAGVWATVGVHPHEATEGVDGIVALLGGHKVVAVGECGLDYFYDHSPREVQREVFAAQVALAHAHDLALVIHTRDAWDDTFDILAAEGAPERTVFHCFTGGPAEARRALDTGAFLSFSGIVSFTTATDVRAAAALCPADRLLVETDSPYLAPVPHRGRRNRPAWVPMVGQAVATARREPLDELAACTFVNAAIAFSLPST